MDIYLIRHTKTDTEDGLCYGQSDVPLAASFADEVRQLHEKLTALSEDCTIYSSPLTRCLQLAQTFEKPVRVDSRLLEVNFGDWENRRFSEIDEGLLRDWTENFVTTPPPNGETFEALCQRVGGFWNELIAQRPGSQVLLITHAGVIRALFTHILQLPPANAFKFRVEPGSVHKLKYINDYVYVHYTNR